MRLVRIRNTRLAAVAPKRPPGYLAELERHVVKRDAVGVWVDADSPDYQAMRARYAPARTAEKAVPREKWPLHVRLVAKFAKPADKGVGDTVARYADAAGGKAFKAAFKKLAGRDCGCDGRRENLNERYPYRLTAPL